MARERSRFQGVANVVRFNWHFYLLSVVFAVLLFVAGRYFESTLLYLFGALSIIQALVSLGVTFYVYDHSNLYSLGWLDELGIKADGKFISLNAGFDETSDNLRNKFPDAELSVFDFYDPKTQTEVSIRRARELRPTSGDPAKISTSKVPVTGNSVDAIFVIFAAHEIRDEQERIRFFKELGRIAKDSCMIVVTEHLRDSLNLIAYNLGGLHFLSRATWSKTFDDTGLNVSKEINMTPFVTAFVLKKNGNTP
jgi:hypothetical protein